MFLDYRKMNVGRYLRFPFLKDLNSVIYVINKFTSVEDFKYLIYKFIILQISIESLCKETVLNVQNTQSSNIIMYLLKEIIK